MKCLSLPNYFKISSFRKSEGSNENGQLKAPVIFRKNQAFWQLLVITERNQQTSDLNVFLKHRYYFNKTKMKVKIIDTIRKTACYGDHTAITIDVSRL